MLPIVVVIGGLILGAFAAGAVIYLVVRLTISFIKKYRLRKASVILAARVKELIKEGIKNRNSVKLDDLPDEDDIVIAEYDEEEDELAQDISVAHDVDERMEKIIDENEGIVIFE